MSRSRREYASLALSASGLVALVVVAVLVFQTGEDKCEPRALAEPNPATAPAGELATRPDDETAAMSLHDAPRELPDVHFMDGSGKRLSLADFRGQLVLLNLWATWCGPCREAMPTLDRPPATPGGSDFEVVPAPLVRAGLGGGQP